MHDASKIFQMQSVGFCFLFTEFLFPIVRKRILFMLIGQFHQSDNILTASESNKSLAICFHIYMESLKTYYDLYP